MDTRAFIQARIDATKLQIIAFENASLQLAENEIQSYTMDTGQTRQVVTRLELGALERAIDGLYNRCATLEARLNGGAVLVRPLW